MGTRTDSELVAAYAAERDEPFDKAQGEAAFAELVARHTPMVYRAALRMLNSRQDAEDATQAVFVVLLRKLPGLKREGDLSGWLYGVARRTALKVLDRRARQARQEDAAAMLQETLGEQSVDESTREQALACLDAELAALPSAQRQAVILRYLKGYSQEEAARLAGCPLGTLTQRASRAIARLGTRLAKRGIVLGGTALVGVLTSEASAAIPETLLPSIMTASKIAAAGAAAGAASGGTAMTLANEVIKAMFWANVKLAAAVVATVAVVSGSAVAVTNTVMQGTEPPPRDLRINQVVVDSARDALVFDVTVHNGIQDRLDTTMDLEHGDRKIATKRISLQQGDNRVSMTCVPDATGVLRFRLKLPVFPGEADTRNNEYDVTAYVVGRTVRTLLIAGEASRDYLYLVDTLRQDPVVSLSCWLQRADVDYTQQGSMNIKRLPQNQAEWEQYDVCILCDPDPNRLTTQQVSALENMVRKGGGLLLIAGRNQGMAKLLQVHAVKMRDMLPVEIDKNLMPDYFDRLDKPFEVERTPVGKGHPIMFASRDEALNERIWSTLPKSCWSQPIQRVKPAAVVLLRKRGGDGALMAIQRYGEGAVLYCGLNDLWRWRFPREGFEEHRFWARVIRQLGEMGHKDNPMEVALDTGRATYAPGEQATTNDWNWVRELPAPTAVAAAEKAMAFLAAAQNADGSWSDTPATNRTAATALSCLALMAEGSQPRVGRYGAPLAKGIELLLKNVQTSGLIGEKGSVNPMAAHAWSLLALTAAQGETPWEPQIRSVVERGLEVLRKSQHLDGGWGLEAAASGDSVPEVTADVLRALRFAGQCGYTVSSRTLEQGAGYVEKKQSADPWPAAHGAVPLQQGKQREDGAFSDGQGNTVYPTALALLALQAPNGYLPFVEPCRW